MKPSLVTPALFCLLILTGFGSFGQASQQPGVDSIRPADNPLRQILDSLRTRSTLKGLKIKLQDINFETNSFRLVASSATYLDTVAVVLNKIPALIIEIGGHTDNVGLPGSNQILSENRARAVRNWLVGIGNVAAKRVTFRGYGETRPVATNAGETGRLLNRRVEMVFVGLDNAQVNRIYRRDGRIIAAPLVYVDATTQNVLYKTDENAPLIELPCTEVEKVIFADGRTQMIQCRTTVVVQTQETPPPVDPPKSRQNSRLYIQLHGASGYMIGEKPSWTSKTNGYAHVLGFGGELLVGYQFLKRLGVGLKTGYWQWSTQVDYKAGADGPVVRQYRSKATQIPVYVALPIYLTNNVYLTPEGGINLLRINAGFDAERYQFTGLQTGYGGTLGYTTNRSRGIQLDVGLVYRTFGKVTWDKEYGVPPMQYAGLKVGLSFSL